MNKNPWESVPSVSSVYLFRRTSDVGAPDLTDYQPDPDFLRTWLKDPAAVRPDTWMPNLELKEWEIEALIAFLGGSGAPDS